MRILRKGTETIRQEAAKGVKRSCAALLQDFWKKDSPGQGEQLTFAGVGNRDVYNITAPFQDNGQWIIAGRVENRQSEQAVVKFFQECQGVWLPRQDLPVFPLQDPFICRVQGELVFGGVELVPPSWLTRFYRGPSLAGLTPLGQGPLGMKDIRLAEMADGRIAVFTRPMGRIGGRGTIGFTVISELAELNPTVIEHATLLDQFVDQEWGGANEVHLLKNGFLGVLGHIACFDERGRRHYYAMEFCLNPATAQASPLTLLAVRANFPPGPAKRPDLVDVVFSGGLRRLSGGTARLYAGVSDVEAHSMLIADPFLKYESAGETECLS